MIIGLTVAPWKFDVLKLTSILAREAKLRWIIVVLRDGPLFSWSGGDEKFSSANFFF